MEGDKAPGEQCMSITSGGGEGDPPHGAGWHSTLPTAFAPDRHSQDLDEARNVRGRCGA